MRKLSQWPNESSVIECVCEGVSWLTWLISFNSGFMLKAGEGGRPEAMVDVKAPVSLLTVERKERLG